MLDDEKKKLIEAEERFRHEIKVKLETENALLKKGVKNRLFEFFNSSAGTWFLSSVIVTGGAGLYQQIEHHHEDYKMQYEQRIKYHFEIESRIDQMDLALRKSKTVGEAKEALQRLYKSKFPLSPELENRSLGSMYLNLYDLLSGSDKERAEEALNFILQLENAEEVLENQADNQPLSEKDKVQLTKLIQAVKELHFQRAT